MINTLLLTKREGRTGKYWQEVVAVTEVRQNRPRTNIPQYGPEHAKFVRVYYMAPFFIEATLSTVSLKSISGAMPGNSLSLMKRAAQN